MSAVSGSLFVGLFVLAVYLAVRPYTIFVRRDNKATNKTNIACAIIDSFLVTKEGLWLGKSSLLSNMAESENVNIGVGCWG